jgi:branched-chain amino acid transport system permease protein
VIVGESTLVFVALGGIFAFSFYAVLVAGQLSLGQAGFAALAAYASAILAPDPQVVGEGPALAVALVIGPVVGAVAALVLGLPTMHLRGVFLAIATLGFAEAVRIVLLNVSWSGGAQGLSVPKLLEPWTAWAVLAALAYVFWRQAGSRYGRALTAVREDELAARSMGIDVGRHRLAAFLTAGAVAGLYGVLWAYFVRLVVPGDFGFATAMDGLVTAVVGGASVWFGPVLGGAFLTLVPELQRLVGLEAGWVRPLVASLLLLIVVLFRPGGLASLLPARWTRTRLTAEVATTGGPAASGRSPTQVPGETDGERVAVMTAVSKDYGGVHAVRDVDLELRQGEVLGLIGPNGAGKTTLVNMLSGLVAPSGGQIDVLGTDPVRVPVHRVAAAGLSRTFQHAKLFGRLTAVENVLVGAHLRSRPTFLRRLVWLPSARRDERAAVTHARDCLARVGLEGAADVRAGALSYGDQRRLEIARALASGPRVLLLDEPAAGMNAVEADTLSALVTALAAEGLAVLLIEHDVGMVLRTCDRVVVLDFGAVIAAGAPEDVRNDPAVVAAYLGADDDVPDDGPEHDDAVDATATDDEGAR